jgi:hypothetical protein
MSLQPNTELSARPELSPESLGKPQASVIIDLREMPFVEESLPGSITMPSSIGIDLESLSIDRIVEDCSNVGDNLDLDTAILIKTLLTGRIANCIQAVKFQNILRELNSNELRLDALKPEDQGVVALVMHLMEEYGITPVEMNSDPLVKIVE